MQKFNKEAAKRIIVHTWYLYPIAVIIITLLLIWGFGAYHQPSAHQTISIFIGCNVRNNKFINPIQEHYERDKLRQINVNYAMPTDALYPQKLKIHLSQSDILILPKATVDVYKSHYEEYFIEFSASTKEQFFKDGYQYYDQEGHDFGIMFRKQDMDNPYDQYMTFYNDDYYLVITKASTNTGKLYNEKNEYYDNALTIVNYLMEGINA